jgi:hypothetical protein
VEVDLKIEQRRETMKRIAIVSALLAAVGAIAVQATTLAAIIQKISENCDKIQSYSADVRVRYKI